MAKNRSNSNLVNNDPLAFFDEKEEQSLRRWLSKKGRREKILKDIQDSLDKSDAERYCFSGMDDGELDSIIVNI